MTKKAIKEKYTKAIQSCEELKQYCKDEIQVLINIHCTKEEVEEEHFADLVVMTIERIKDKKDKKRLLRKYASYEKERREILLLKEIIEDIQ